MKRSTQPMTDAEIQTLNAAYEAELARRQAAAETDDRVDASTHIVTADVAREANLEVVRADDQSGVLYRRHPDGATVYGWESGGFSAPNE